MLLPFIILLPFLGSLLAVLLPTHARNQEAWLAGLIAFSCLAIVLFLAPDIFQGHIYNYQLDWIPSLSLSFHLEMDGFSWLFAFLVSAMGLLVVIYARYYMDPADPVPRFFSFFLIFMGSMLGLVLSGNVIQLAMFWELTSLSSFMLIAYWYHRADARRGAKMALTITATGGFSLLAAMLMIGNVVGSYELDIILDSGNLIKHSTLYPYIVITFAIAVLSKSAQFPFHFWLPNAMAAPTPVSAYLHSATLVKVGVFAIARFWPVLSGTDLWFWIISGSGLISLTLGAYFSLFQNDMKGILAYSTISHLGLITLLLGMNSELALMAAVFHMMNHATFKASLFMASGIVDHETGTRNIGVLSGLSKVMPLTTTLAVVAAAAMAGVPLLNGFISKEMFFSETLFAGSDQLAPYVLPIMAVIAGTFSVAYSYRFIVEVFFGPSPNLEKLPRTPKEPPLLMIVPSAILVLICLLVGIFPEYTIGPLLHISIESILLNHVPSYSLAVWHGINTPLIMSLMAFFGGITLAQLMRKSILQYPDETPLFKGLHGKDFFDKGLDLLDSFSDFMLQIISSTRLQVQVLLIVTISFIVSLIPILGTYSLPSPDFSNLNFAFAILWAAGASCAVVAANQARYHRFRSLVFVGGTGIVVSITFAWLSSPDLALTQLVVEIVTVILLLLGLRWLPRNFRTRQSDFTRTLESIKASRDLTLAIGVGIGMSLLSYIIMMRSEQSELGQYYIDNALTKGGGTNIVNVILVDFRGFDTLGEITVLGIVAISVYALLRRFRPPQEMIHILDQRRSYITPDLRLIKENSSLPKGTMLVPNVLVRLLMPIISLIAFYFFFRGHDLPGGGFISGLIFAIGVLLQYIISGIYWVEKNSRIRPQNWLAIGLILALGSGLLPIFFGKPFLTAISKEVYLPIVGEVTLSSVLTFDLGVFFLVVGCTTYMLVALAHQSLRFYRTKPSIDINKQ